MQEAGGVVTDLQGNALDWTHGRTLKNNRGILAAGDAKTHAQVLEFLNDEQKTSHVITQQVIKRQVSNCY